MKKVYVVVNNYLFTQGINSVVDQFINNRLSLKQKGIEVVGVVDCLKLYTDIPDRKQNHSSTKQLNSKIKARTIYRSTFGNTISILLHGFRVGKKAAKVAKFISNDDNELFIFQDVFAAYYAIKKYKLTNSIYMTHSYEDELEQLLMNYPYIKGHFIESLIRKMYKYVYNHTIRNIVICKKAKEWVNSHNPEAKIEILYNSVQDVCVNKSLIPHEKINIVMASSIGIRKGFDIFGDALSLIPSSTLEKCHFHIYGDGDYLDTLKVICKNKSINNITFYGRYDKPYKNYDNMDAYLMTSRSETLPMSIIEAMMCSLPIFSTNVGAISEMVNVGENGYLYDPDAESICRAIEDITNLRSQLTTMGVASRKMYQDRFNEDVWIERVSDIILK